MNFKSCQKDLKFDLNTLCIICILILFNLNYNNYLKIYQVWRCVLIYYILILFNLNYNNYLKINQVWRCVLSGGIQGHQVLCQEVRPPLFLPRLPGREITGVYIFSKISYFPPPPFVTYKILGKYIFSPFGVRFCLNSFPYCFFYV